MPKIYSVYTGLEAEGDGFFTANRAEAVKVARDTLKETDGLDEINVEELTIDQPTLASFIAVLNGEGYVRERRVVETVHRRGYRAPEARQQAEEQSNEPEMPLQRTQTHADSDDEHALAVQQAGAYPGLTTEELQERVDSGANRWGDRINADTIADMRQEIERRKGQL